jgi:hypothetical protein
MKIAILGARGTGKSLLTQALNLQASSTPVKEPPWVCFDNPSFEPRPLYEVTLLMGLDLDPSTHIGADIQVEDNDLRCRLEAQGIPYTVVYGTGQSRVACALQIIEYHHRKSGASSDQLHTTWQWTCEKCSDAGCEHRMFSALVNKDSVQV